VASREGPSGKLTLAIRLLDRAVKAVPAARYFWGVIAASATVTVISWSNGLNRLTFVAMVAAIVAMFVFYIFSRFEKASDPVVKLLGYLLLIVAALGFVFVIFTSAWLALTCSPRVMAHVYGIAEVCYGTNKSVETSVAEPRKTQTLEELSQSDFPNQWGWSMTTWANSLIDTDRIKITSTVFYDFDTNSEFLSFYVPFSLKTYELIGVLSERYPIILRDLNSRFSMTSKNPGDYGYRDTAGFIFSNVIYIYAEVELSLQQAATVDYLFKQKGVSVYVRGPAWASTRMLQDAASPPPPHKLDRFAMAYKLSNGELPTNVPNNIWENLETNHLVGGQPTREGINEVYRGFIEDWFTKNPP
jgi:hypothetical protein